MPRKQPWDPLDLIPPPDAIRERLASTVTLAARLRTLLKVSERIHRQRAAARRRPDPTDRKDVPNG